MHARMRRIAPVIVILVLLLAAGAWYLWSQGNTNTNGKLSASGTVEAVEVIVAPELSGRVSEVLADKGDSVTVGQPLIRLDGTLLQAQRRQAEAAIDTAKAGVATTQAALETARRQYQQILEAARLADSPARAASWMQSQPWQFDQPTWYFDKSEQIAAAQAEADAAWSSLVSEKTALQTLLDSPQYFGVQAAEQQLTEARAAFLAAQDTLDRAKNASENEDLLSAAQDRFDAADQELKDAQTAYDDLLDETQSDDLLKARARVRAEEERYRSALDRVARLHTGEYASSVQVAAAGVAQAEKAVAQADLALIQAQTQLDLIDTQIAKLSIYAPADGTLLERNIEPGEMALAGSSLLVIGRLDRLTITVYLPEDRYGEIRLEQDVTITVDSFPDATFSGEVSRIADRAEFTPRNVQTEEGRRTTVFAVEIRVTDTTGRLKPGMPADVTFGE